MSAAMEALWQALLLQSGYNVTIVTLGAALLGMAAGTTGTFLFLRKRALVSDSIAHATLPGVGLAFIVMVALGGDGRNLPVLLIGSAITATLGLLTVEWITRRTRLAEDAAIGAVLSVFFGFGVVLLTVIQTMPSGRQAGLQSFLLGATAGMQLADAILIVIASAAAMACVFVLRRPMMAVAFDPGFAAAHGYDLRRMDLAMMGLAMAVTVIGMSIVGLVLIVALLIIPAVTARLWSERTDHVVLASGLLGAVSGYAGTAISASAPALPTGPVIVLVAAFLFVVSMVFAPGRGMLAAIIRHRRFQLRVHRRQGLLALARNEPVFDGLTLTVLRRGGFMRADGVATEAGRAQAAKALRDEKRWEIVRETHADEAVVTRYDGLTPIEEVLTADEIAEVDKLLGGPAIAATGGA